MGWDISYHPISEKQILERYFDVLENPKHIETIIRKHKIEDFYAEKYRNTMRLATTIHREDIFDKTHGFYIAIVQGFFNDFYYTRGSGFSFLDKEIFKNYSRPWQEFVPDKYLTEKISNRIIENYCSGVFIPYPQVCHLLKDYEQNPQIHNLLNEHFSHGRIDIFLKALRYAQAEKVGILEATEVIEPNLKDLNNSSSYSNLLHCDIEGPLLFQQEAMKQL